ncbi:saccharopine dehydrogenase family protein [Streptomyces sp. NPDC020983]|uniref:saccharopine dehydrogenase family protein n=1 Tax=Streptomyces sp. NPDC020983 TaxID=3365106 RepID=UPI003797DE18
MNSNETRRVMVYGATGHTGRFVVDELLRRGITPVVAGRDPARLRAVAQWPALEQRAFALDDPARVEAALADVDVVVNCAGPFLDTALPLAAAAVASGTHYLDVTAEQPVVQTLYDELDGAARSAGVAVVPAMAFYGGLADLMATSLLGAEESRAEVTVAIGLDHWWPTAGTRVTGERNTAVRQVVRDGELVPLKSPAPTATWAFGGALGDQEVVELPFSETITLHRHLPVDRLTSYLSTGSLAELREAGTPGPSAADESGRSLQQFTVDVVVSCGGSERRMSLSGRDIYAVTAPIVVEGVVRLLDGRVRSVGAVPPGAAFHAADVLAALADHSAGIRIDRPAARA